MKLCSPDLDAKAKKPFLKRLMSCLVLRSKTSEKIGPDPVSYSPTVNSSIDSYHISTSLGVSFVLLFHFELVGTVSSYGVPYI